MLEDSALYCRVCRRATKAAAAEAMAKNQPESDTHPASPRKASTGASPRGGMPVEAARADFLACRNQLQETQLPLQMVLQGLIPDLISQRLPAAQTRDTCTSWWQTPGRNSCPGTR
eukprot:2857888-Rhodomonas_salina.1